MRWLFFCQGWGRCCLRRLSGRLLCRRRRCRIFLRGLRLRILIPQRLYRQAICPSLYFDGRIAADVLIQQHPGLGGFRAVVVCVRLKGVFALFALIHLHHIVYDLMPAARFVLIPDGLQVRFIGNRPVGILPIGFGFRQLVCHQHRLVLCFLDGVFNGCLGKRGERNAQKHQHG